MDYEKKYKEALVNMQELYNSMKCMSSTDALHTTTALERAFPELKESDDERIRKGLIHQFTTLGSSWDMWGSMKREDILAWLEKQKPTTDIQNLTWEDIEKIGELINMVQYENPNGIGAECLYTDILERFLDGKQTKQKPVDKVEPKFKVSDWIVKNDGKDCFSDDSYVLQITDINDIRYKLSNGCYLKEPFAATYRLWTIQDAKDGDVLVDSKGDVILMFRGFGNTEWDDVIDYHCYYRKDFIVQKNSEYWGKIENSQLKPATKEQRDLLFQKMKEAGYMWDAEKKELKKISQEYPLTPDECIKPAWSEEDEKHRNAAICACSYMIENFENSTKIYEDAIEWLKSLKPQPQWKPSDDQIAVLRRLINLGKADLYDYRHLKRLLEQLEKL